MEAIRSADLRLATIGYRLSVAAAPLCDRLEPGTGLQLHSLAQYGGASRSAMRAHFGFAGPVAIEAIVAHSPAERAGLRQDDTIVSIGGVVAPVEVPDAPSTAELAGLHSRVADLPSGKSLEISVIRFGTPLTVQVTTVPACRTRYELRIADRFDARATGEMVQISSKYLEAIDADLLPAVVAHELAHNILRHRDRLVDRGADFGLASGFGRNVGLFRQTEIQADILSVHLLARAGYSPELAARFWSEVGPKLMAGMIRSRSHPAIADRIATVEAEAARIGNQGDAAPLPAFYHRRTDPLDGKWQPLLVRARR